MHPGRPKASGYGRPVEVIRTMPAPLLTRRQDSRADGSGLPESAGWRWHVPGVDVWLRGVAAGVALLGLPEASPTAEAAEGAPQKKLSLSAPIHDFSLPLFTKEGFRTLLLLGGEARFENLERITIRNMQLTLFTGDATEKIDTIFISAAATFFPELRRAEGDAGVRIVGDEAEMSGDRWSYDHNLKKVVLDGRVRVIFRAQLDAFLK